MSLVEIFTNASAYQIVGAGVGVIAGYAAYKIVDGVLSGFSLLAAPFAVALGVEGKEPPKPKLWEKARDAAAAIAIVTVFYGACAGGGYLVGTGVEALVSPKKAPQTAPAAPAQPAIR